MPLFPYSFQLPETGTTSATIWPQWVTTASTAPNYQATGTSSQVWPTWVGANVYASEGVTPGTVYATGASAWPRWVAITDPPTTSYSFQTQVWTDWQGQPITAQQYYDGGAVLPSAIPESDEQRAAREKRLARSTLISRNRSRTRQLRAKFAERRAEELLLECLDDRQREEWTAHRYFHVETADGRRRYRIDRGTAGNVHLVKCEENPLPEGAWNHGRLRDGTRFCYHVYHPDGHIPAEDNVLAQKLLLETDEQRFLTGANIS